MAIKNDGPVRSSSTVSRAAPKATASVRPASTSAASKPASAKFGADEMSSGRGGALRANATKLLGASGLSTAGVKSTAAVALKPKPGTDPVDKLPMPEAARQNVKDARDGKFGPTVAAQTKQALAAVSSLPPAAQASALTPIGADPTSKAAASSVKVLTSAGFKALPPAQQAKLCTVVGAASEKGLAALETLSATPARLADTDKNGQTLVDNLALLATHDVNADLLAATPDARTQVLDNVLQEVSDPGRYVVQGGFNTCQVASAQYALVQANPAEYARLMAGLTGPEGRAEMRGGGVLELQKEYLSIGTDARSLSNALFQGAGMEFTNGLLQYDAATDQQNYLLFQHTGLLLTQENALPSNLFGQNYVQSVPLLGRADPRLDFLAQYDTTQNGAPVLLDLQLPNMDGLLHIVTFDHIEDGRVYFRNPWGPSGSPVGAEGNSGRLEDPATGLYSMPIEQLQEITAGVHLPADALAEFDRQQAAAQEQYLRPPTPPAPTPTGTPTPGDG